MNVVLSTQMHCGERKKPEKSLVAITELTELGAVLDFYAEKGMM